MLLIWVVSLTKNTGNRSLRYVALKKEVTGSKGDKKLLFRVQRQTFNVFYHWILRLDFPTF